MATLFLSQFQQAILGLKQPSNTEEKITIQIITDAIEQPVELVSTLVVKPGQKTFSLRWTFTGTIIID